MAYATKKLDPFGSRMLSIRLQQKKVAQITTEPAKTDTCCPTQDTDTDEDDPLGCNEPDFDMEPVSTGCKDCGKGSADTLPLLDSPTEIKLLAMVRELQTYVESLESRIARLE